MIFLRFKPQFDRFYKTVLILTSVFVLGVISVVSFFAPESLFVMIPSAAFVAYFILSSLVCYVELREKTCFIKFGFFTKREIEYSKITSVQMARGFYSESMLAVKNSIEHVNLWCGRFSATTVSVVDNPAFVRELEARIAASRSEIDKSASE